MKITFIIGIIGFLYSILMIFNMKDLFLKLASVLFTLLFIYLYLIFGTSDYIDNLTPKYLVNQTFNLEAIIVVIFFIITTLSLISCIRNPGLRIMDKILFIGFVFSFFGVELVWPFLGVRWENFDFYRLLFLITIIIFVYFLVKALYKKNLNILKFLALFIFYYGYETFTHVIYSIE